MPYYGIFRCNIFNLQKILKMKLSYKIGLACATVLLIVAFAMPTKKNPQQKMKEPIVTIETNLGTIKVKLYNETPLHRDNFIKLAEQHFYDSLLFHRVIGNFMIQTGDPKSKGAKQGEQLGFGGPGYTIPAEFNANCIHKKGALAAARLGGPQNPKKESSGSQFYIVIGQQVTAEQLDQMALNKVEQAKNEFINKELYKPENKSHLDTLIAFQKAQNREGFIKEYNNVLELYKDTLKTFKPITYTDAQKEIYKTIGGTPHLDMDYTVFGEVIEGLNIVDSIAKVKTDQMNRPLQDIMILNVSVEK